MILSTHGIVGSQITQFVGLLDLYPNAAAAYSLRKLRSAYTGSAIRVRRSSGGEQNIGFVDNVLDTASLLSFVGSGDGFVTTWYDQSGNAENLTQTIAAYQPQIVTSGVVLTRNSKPILQTDGSRYMLNLFFPLYGNIGSIFFSIYLTSARASVAMMSGLNDPLANEQHWPSRSGTGDNRYYNSLANLTLAPLPTGLNLISIFQNTSTQVGNAFENSVQVATNYTTNNGELGGSLTVFARFGGNNALLNEYGIPEFIIYPSNQSSNRTGIESNINSYYGIY
jgi:hypothetical protein